MKYFYIAYSHKDGFGSCTNRCEFYPNKNEIKNDVKKSGVDDIIIINIMELTKPQFELFYKD